MPVSVITDVITWIELIAQIGVTTVELGVLTYLVFFDGWLDMIRLISFWLDKTIIKYIDQFYKYFEKILAGEIFSPTVVENVMKNVYIFVALIVLLKLLLLFMKYLSNPEMVSDDKVGAQALVKRVIIGMCGMLALPMIFSFSVDVQKAILNDNLFGKLLLDKKQLKEYEKNQHQMGRMLAFNVYQAFWNLDKTKVTSSKLQKEYDDALKTYDPGVIGSINEKFGSDYAYDYFPIASTVVLLYVIYLVIKYCIDVVVRMFKLFLLQMLGPLAISDYMVNGDSKEVFKNWLKTSLSVYAMLFVRIFSIWFIAFIMILMQGTCTHFEKDPNTGKATTTCADESLLYIAPGQEPDYLLRGIITLGLLALLMDLPKFLSDILGLDLEQDATVKGLMQKAGGMAKGAATAGLAFGGAAVGGAIGAGKSAIGATKFGKSLNQSKTKMAEKHGALSALGGQGSAYGKGMLAAALNTNSVTGSAVRGYQGQKQAQEGEADKQKSRVEKAKAEREQQAKELQDVTRNVVERLAETADRNTSKDDLIVMAKAQLYGDPGEVTAKVRGILDSSGISEVGEVTQTVKQVLGERFDVAPGEVEQVVKQVVKDPANVTPGEVEQIVNQVIGQRADAADQTITQVVNQVYGTRVNNAVEDATQKVTQEIERVNTTVEDATQKVTQQLDQVVTNTEEINVYSEISTEHIEHMRQQVDLQRNNNNNP